MADVRILLIGGHGAGDPGACGYMVEADETRRVIQGVKNHFNGYDVVLDLYPMNRNAMRMLRTDVQLLISSTTIIF